MDVKNNLKRFEEYEKSRDRGVEQREVGLYENKNVEDIGTHRSYVYVINPESKSSLF